MSELLNAICRSQISIGNQMGANAKSATVVGDIQTAISKNWMGQPTDFDEMLAEGLVDEKTYMPTKDTKCYTTEQISAIIQYIATKEANPKVTGDELTKLESARQTWTSTSSAMSNFKDMQLSPIQTTAQSESSQIQQDQSMVSGSSSLGSIQADMSGITASIIGNVAA